MTPVYCDGNDDNNKISIPKREWAFMRPQSEHIDEYDQGSEVRAQR